MGGKYVFVGYNLEKLGKNGRLSRQIALFCFTHIQIYIYIYICIYIII